MSAEIFQIIVPIFVIASIGYFIEASGKGFNTESMSRLVMWVGTPALVFASLTDTELPNETLGRIALIGIASIIVSASLSGLVLKLMRLPLRTYLAALSVPNSGNAGLPIAFFAFSDIGLTIGVAFFFVIALVQYTVVPTIVSGNFHVRKTLKEPLVWAVFAVLAFKLAKVNPPEIISETTRMLGGIMIPVMLLLLGGALAQLKVKDMGLSVFLAILRLVIGCVTGYLVILIFELKGTEAGVIFIMASMPSALVTYVVSEHFGREPEKVAGLVVSSTILTFLCLPLLLNAAQYLSHI